MNITLTLIEPLIQRLREDWSCRAMETQVSKCSWVRVGTPFQYLDGEPIFVDVIERTSVLELSDAGQCLALIPPPQQNYTLTLPPKFEDYCSLRYGRDIIFRTSLATISDDFLKFMAVLQATRVLNP